MVKHAARVTQCGNNASLLFPGITLLQRIIFRRGNDFGPRQIGALSLASATCIILSNGVLFSNSLPATYPPKHMTHHSYDFVFQLDLEEERKKMAAFLSNLVGSLLGRRGRKSACLPSEAKAAVEPVSPPIQPNVDPANARLPDELGGTEAAEVADFSAGTVAATFPNDQMLEEDSTATDLYAAEDFGDARSEGKEDADDQVSERVLELTYATGKDAIAVLKSEHAKFNVEVFVRSSDYLRRLKQPVAGSGSSPAEKETRVRRSRMERADDEILRARLLCRTHGCHWSSTVRREDRPGHPSGFRIDVGAPHNHPLVSGARTGTNIPAKALQMAYNFYKTTRATVTELANAVLNEFPDAKFTAKELRSRLASLKRTFQPKELEGSNMVALLQKMHSEDEGMFFDFTLCKCDGALQNVCFALPEWRAWYREYGIVVSIDPKGRTNRFNMPCVVVLGTSHVGATVPFFCALLAGETKECFDWMLAAFKRCHELRPDPAVVFTDHASTLISCIQAAFPESQVRLDAFHLNQSIKKHLANDKEATDDIYQLRHSSDEAEAKSMKDAFIAKYQPGQWFSDWWEDRAMWVGAWLKNSNARFCALMNGTTRSESFNSKLDALFNTPRSDLACFPVEMSRVTSDIVQKLATARVRGNLKGSSNFYRTLAGGVTSYAYDKFIEKSHAWYERWTAEKDGTYLVKSNICGAVYLVKIENGRPICPCSAPTRQGIPCKHSLRVVTAFPQEFGPDVLLRLCHPFWLASRSEWTAIIAADTCPGTRAEAVEGPPTAEDAAVHVPSGKQLYIAVDGRFKMLMSCLQDKTAEMKVAVLTQLDEIVQMVSNPHVSNRPGRKKRKRERSCTEAWAAPSAKKKKGSKGVSVTDRFVADAV